MDLLNIVGGCSLGGPLQSSLEYSYIPIFLCHLVRCHVLCLRHSSVAAVLIVEIQLLHAAIVAMII